MASVCFFLILCTPSAELTSSIWFKTAINYSSSQVSHIPPIRLDKPGYNETTFPTPILKLIKPFLLEMNVFFKSVVSMRVLFDPCALLLNFPKNKGYLCHLLLTVFYSCKSEVEGIATYTFKWYYDSIIVFIIVFCSAMSSCPGTRQTLPLSNIRKTLHASFNKNINVAEHGGTTIQFESQWKYTWTYLSPACASDRKGLSGVVIVVALCPLKK